MNDILKLYNQQVRANPTATLGLRVVLDNDVTRLEGAFNFVCSWNFSDTKAQKRIAYQANHFRQLDESLIWRVYDHDKPSNIEKCLEIEGFEVGAPGTFMALSLDTSNPPKNKLDIRKISTLDSLKEYVTVASTAFGTPDELDFEYYAKLWSDPNVSFYCGYENNVAVACSRMEVVPGTNFGLLFAGAVLPSHRRKGFYKELVYARINAAKKLSLKYLTTEAFDSSRPILEKLGFDPICRERTWALKSKQ